MLLTALCCGGSIARAGDNDYRFINLTTRDGFRAGTVTCFLQDRSGFIWIGTEAGLLRFDGIRLETFRHRFNDSNTISGNYITSLVEDKRGQIWIATAAEGLNCYDPVRRRFKHYVHNPADPVSLRTDRVGHLRIDAAGRLWIGYIGHGWSVMDMAAGRMKHFKGSTLFVDTYGYDASNWVEGFLEDSKGGMYIPTNYGLRHHTADGRILTYTSITGTTNAHNDNLFTSGCRGNDSTLWLGTWGAGLKSFNTRTQTFTQHLWTPVNPTAAIRNIVLDLLPKNDSELWVASADAGLGTFNTRNGAFSFIPHNPQDPASPLPAECYGLYKDREGTLWAGFHTGVSRLPAIAGGIRFTPVRGFKKEWEGHFHPADFYKDPQTGLLYVAFANGQGLYIIDEARGTERLVRIPPGGGHDRPTDMVNVFSIALVDSERLLLSTSFGLFVYDKRNGTVQSITITDQHRESIWCFGLMRTAGAIWANGHERIYRVSPDLRTAVCFDERPASPLQLPPVRKHIVLAESDTTIWVNAIDRGVYRLNHARGTFTHLRGTRNRSIFGKGMIKDGRGEYWFASESHGLFRMTPAGRDSVRIRQYGEEDGLASESMGRPVLDAVGNLIVSTEKGPSVLLRGEDRFISFRENNLLTSDSRIFTRLYADSSGRVYQGFLQGYYSWNTDALMALRTRPRLVLTGIRVFDKPLFDTVDLQSVREISLPHDQNSITFSFAAPDYLAPAETRYFSRMEGDEGGWIACGQTLSYSQMSPGEYTLRIRAVSGLGLPAENELRVAVRIRPPFWRTWWFYALLALAVSSLVFAAFRYRIGVIRARERLKTEYNKTLAEVEMKALRAQMNPHFLFNCLNSINRYILEKDTRRASAYLTKFAKLIRLILENSAADSVSLGSELELLRLYIEMEAMRFGDKFTYSIEVDPALQYDTVHLPSMIVQPYVENAVWHGLLHKAADRHLTLRFRRAEGSVLEVVVEDNGVGRARAAELKSKGALKRKSYGMQITDNRIRALNLLNDAAATVVIEDLVDDAAAACGTRVTLRIPFTETGVARENPVSA